MVWPVLVLPLVLAWYILTELGSILENASKMGAPLPSWLMKLLKVGLKAIDNKADTQDTSEEE
jgi:phage-related holin